MRLDRIIALSLAAVFGAIPAAGQDRGAWLGTDVNAPAVAGRHEEKNGALTLTGYGKGEGLKQAHGQDQLYFAYKTLPPGDVEVIARITAFEGKAGKAMAGLMIRDGLAPTAKKAVVGFFVESDTHSGVFGAAHDPRTKHTGSWSAHGVTAMRLPMWLRLVRVGKDFAVTRSGDGKHWVQVHNESGAMFLAEGPLQAGFFAAGGDPDARATVTFDQISVGKPKLAYRSSWIGNSFGQASVSHVSNALLALWVAPDGTCYANSHYDEAGESAKIYKDGKVLGIFRKEYDAAMGNSLACEGTVCADATQTYIVSSEGRVFASDLLGRSSATRDLYFADSVWDASERRSVVSGMVSAGGFLFLGDSRANKIRVAQTAPKPRLYTAGNSSVAHAAEAVAVTGVANAAPARVYASQRECDYLPYQIPGLKPDVDYTARFHFAEYKHDEPGRRVMEVMTGERKVAFDIVKAAGGKFKAAVLDIPKTRADAQGIFKVTLGVAQDSPDRHMVICGLEILQPDGKTAFALNCGGPQAGAFQSEVDELPERAFDFLRPGPMTADKRGELWIIQAANDFPVDMAVTTKYPGSVRCYRADGTFTGRAITDVVNPTAVAYDAKSDRLLVAENGPDQNIRLYGHLDRAPAHVGSFGVKGGIYAGKTPGRLFDPKEGGWARFYGLKGVGVDAEGNFYVACSPTGTDLRKYTPDGKLVWAVHGLHFIDCADPDPDSDGQEVYVPFKRYTMDYAKTTPGAEWTYAAYGWNPFKYGAPPRQRGSTPVVRRVGPGRALMLYTSGQGQMNYVGIYRFDGDIAVPAGRMEKNRKGCLEIWVDANGDGKEDAAEVSMTNDNPDMGHPQSFSVDQKGDVWLALVGAPTLRHVKFKGLNAHGAPIYGTNPGDVEDIPFPGTGAAIRPSGCVARVSYDAERDVMYLMGPAKERKSDKENPITYLARYDRWSAGNRTARWLKVLPNPTDDPGFMYGDPPPYGIPLHWMAFDVAVDKIFIAELWGPVHVFDAATGDRDIVLTPGPEISGSCAWEDAQMGLRAFKRKNGEYVVFEENSGFGGKNIMYRWTPAKSAP